MEKVNQILIVGSILPLECKNLGQRYIVFDPRGIVGCLTATDYKQPKVVVVKVGGDTNG